ncbi:MAG TPA: heavy metal-associated domain-containing protein [Terriglobales bacterium]|nr:heavy metal-associated domain-containing protein [Terriglobales bacterium]
MKEKSFAVASTLAALLASLCCLGPLLLGGAGLGALLVATFAPLRPYFLAASALLLAGGFYLVYRKPRAKGGCEGETCAPESKTRRMAKPLLWIAAFAVAALALFPSYGARLVGSPAAASQAASAGVRTAELKITGMDCPVCASVIQRKLLQTPGVVGAQVRYPAGSATVRFDPSRTDAGKLATAVKDVGYQAEVSNPGRR